MHYKQHFIIIIVSALHCGIHEMTTVALIQCTVYSNQMNMNLEILVSVRIAMYSSEMNVR